MRKRLLLAIVLVILLTPAAFIAALFYTETGVELLAAQVSKLERLGVRIEGVSGTLAGPLRVARFELTHPRVHVVVHDIVIDPQLRGLLLQTVRTRSATARDALVEVRAADLPESDRPPRFLPQWLRVDARGVLLQRVRYVHLNGAAVEAHTVRGRVTITARQLRVRGFQVDAEQFDAQGDLRLLARKPLGLHGALAGRVRLPRTELVLNANADGDLDRLLLKAELLQPNRLTANATYTREDAQWRLNGEVHSDAFSLAPFIERPPFSLKDVTLNVALDATGVHAVGSLGAPEFTERPFSVDARGRYAQRVLHLNSVDLGLLGASAAVHGAGRIEFVEPGPSLFLALRWRDVQWPLTGEAVVVSESGEGELRGVLPYAFTLNAQVRGPRIPDAQGAARGLLGKDRITLEHFDVQALEGGLQGAGALQWSPPRAWTLSAAALAVNPAVLHEQFPGKLGFNVDARGSGFDKRALFDVDLRNLAGELRGLRVRGAGRVQRTAKEWFARDVDLRYGRAHLTLTGRLNQSVDARWSLRAPSLAELLPDASGALEFSGLASGSRKAPHLVARLTGENLRYQNWLAERVRLDADVDASNANPSRLALNAERLGRGEPWLAELRVTADGVAHDHRIRVEAASFSPEPQREAVRTALQAQGALRELRWAGVVQSAQLTRRAEAEQKLELVEPAPLRASRDEVAVQGLCFGVSAGRLCGEGLWRRDGAWEGVLSGYEIPLALVLPPSGPEADYGGRIEGRVRLHGATDQPWQGEAGMRIVDAAIIYRPVGAEPQTLHLGTGGLAATATPNRINFSFGVQAFMDTFLYANAHIVRESQGSLLHMPLSGDLRARAADANILPLVFPEIDHASGLLTANAAITGSLAAPEINGRIQLANGELDSYRTNLALRDLALQAELANNGVSFRSSARIGEGQVQANGAFAWSQGQSRGDLHLRGDNLLVADLSEYRVTAAPDLRFAIDGARVNVAGDVLIPSALIQPNQLTGAVRASEDARYVGELPAEREGRLTLHSEVRIAMGEDVRIDAFGLTGRITGAVGTTLHTGEEPLGRGELAVAEGKYEAYGQKLDITRGRLLFAASSVQDPGLDIEARRAIETTTVGVNVRGTLQQPRLTFFSDPSMPQSQIVSYLLTGKSINEVQNRDAANVGAARDTLALQGGGLLASQLGRRLGLEEVGVESSTGLAGETNTSLVLGKFLSPRLFISYGISLTESINTLKLRYTLSDRWILRTESGEHQSADVEFTFER